MRRFTLLTMLSLFILCLFSSAALAKDVKNYEFKTYKQGELEVTSNLPEEIKPVVVGKIVDKNNKEKQAKGQVKHTLKNVYRENDKEVYEIQTDVSIQQIMGPYNDSGSHQDTYSHMYQKQTMNWSYYRDSNFPYTRWYKIHKTTCWWERSRTNLSIATNSANLKIEVYGVDMNNYTFSDWTRKINQTPTWTSGSQYMKTSEIVLDGKSSWPYTRPITLGMWASCTSECHDPYGYVSLLITKISL